MFYCEYRDYRMIKRKESIAIFKTITVVIDEIIGT